MKQGILSKMSGASAIKEINKKAIVCVCMQAHVCFMQFKLKTQELLLVTFIRPRYCPLGWIVWGGATYGYIYIL